MNMIDRVAMAICDILEADEYSSLPDGSIVKEAYRQQARAAIEAMVEPTEEMLEAANEHDRGMMPWREQYQSMIREALK